MHSASSLLIVIVAIIYLYCYAYYVVIRDLYVLDFLQGVHGLNHDMLV